MLIESRDRRGIVEKVVGKLNWYHHRYRALSNRLRFIFDVMQAGGSAKLPDSVHFDHPVRFMGRGHVEFGERVRLGYRMAGSLANPIVIEPRNSDAIISIGENTTIVNGTEIIACEKISIGKNCQIGSNIMIIDSDFHGIEPDQRNQPGISAPVTVGDNVWLGTGVMILKGVSVGDFTAIAARTLVVKSLGTAVLAAGSPARVLRALKTT